MEVKTKQEAETKRPPRCWLPAILQEDSYLLLLLSSIPIPAKSIETLGTCDTRHPDRMPLPCYPLLQLHMLHCSCYFCCMAAKCCCWAHLQAAS
jgi:hypothetical protein